MLNPSSRVNVTGPVGGLKRLKSSTEGSNTSRSVGLSSAERHTVSDGVTAESLLEACAYNDHAALERLYRLTAPKLFSTCLHLLRHRDLAEDVLQDAFIQIWRDASRFDANRASAMTWMSIIVRHRAIDMLRRGSRESRLNDAESLSADDDPSSVLEPFERIMNSKRAAALYACLDELAQPQRDAIVLAFYRGFTHQQLAQTLAQPLGSVKSWIRRGMERLKSCLETAG